MSLVMPGTVTERRPDHLAALAEVGRRIARHIAAHRSASILGTLLSFAAAGFGLVSAVLTAAMIDVLQHGTAASARHDVDWGRLSDLNTAGSEASSVLSGLVAGSSRSDAIVLLGGFLLLSTALAVTTNIASRWLWVSVRTRLISAMQADLFAHILQLPMSFHVHMRTGALLSRLYSDVGNVGWVLPVLFHTLLRAPLLMGGAAFAMVRTSAQLTLVTAAAAGVYLLATLLLGRSVRRSYVRQSRSRAGVLALAQEALLGVRVVKAFGAEAGEVRELRAEMDELNREQIRGDLLSAELPQGLSQMLAVGTGVLVIVAGLDLIARGLLTEQGMLLFFVASAAVFATAAVMIEAVMSFNLLIVSAEQLSQIWGVRSPLVDGPMDPPGFDRELRLRDVAFDYGRGPVLRSVDVVIRKGQVVGLVGATGAGKSTVIDLLLRFYDPTTGTVELDGVDVRRFRSASYRRLFGVVPQETLLFNDTVLNNIAYGRPHLTEAEVVAAALTADADGFIRQLPDGYGTLVGERGIRLSGGERQRVALARAIADRPPILIFDEATSALDNRSERLVQAAMERAMRDRTVIIVAHRLTTLRHADRIFVIDDGRIAESGTHEELVAADGVYRRLYEAGPDREASGTPEEVASPERD